MTDRQRMEKTYGKIKEKYPQVTEREKIEELAIRHDKRLLILQSLAWLAGAAACFILFLVLPGSTDINTVRYIFIVMAGSGIFEFFRTLGKLKMVEQRYRPVIKATDEGQLTLDIISKDGKRLLKNNCQQFRIVREVLYDKEDEIDTGLDNETHHTFHLYFRIGANPINADFKVKKSAYINAVIGAPYYLIMTPDGEIACAYQAMNWTIAEELRPYLDESAGQGEAQMTADPVVPHIAVEKVVPVKTKKVLPILSMVLMAVSFLMPVIVGLPMAIAGLVLAIVAIVQQRSKLSIAALIVSIVLFVLVIWSVWMIFAEAVASVA